MREDMLKVDGLNVYFGSQKVLDGIEKIAAIVD